MRTRTRMKTTTRALCLCEINKKTYARRIVSSQKEMSNCALFKKKLLALWVVGRVPTSETKKKGATWLFAMLVIIVYRFRSGYSLFPNRSGRYPAMSDFSTACSSFFAPASFSFGRFFLNAHLISFKRHPRPRSRSILAILCLFNHTNDVYLLWKAI